jgi:DNA-binding MarR family transcriptional regulator
MVVKLLDIEELRLSFNKFLRMYFAACEEVYKELRFERVKGSRFKYLKEIHRRKVTTLTELSEHFELSKPTVNEVITSFENSGLIKKMKSETDRRVTLISLTEIGEILASTNELESKRAVEKMTQILSEEELFTLKKIFDRFGEKQ